jgi:hypothetical protein
LRDQVPETGQTRIFQLIGASAMIGRNILMYFPWNRPDEEGAPPHPFIEQGRKTFDALLQSKPNVFGGRLFICDATIWSSTAGGLGSLRQFWANMTRLVGAPCS